MNRTYIVAIDMENEVYLFIKLATGTGRKNPIPEITTMEVEQPHLADFYVFLLLS